jgi:pimeloyl-ACP methyl ester carboxylesterase
MSFSRAPVLRCIPFILALVLTACVSPSERIYQLAEQHGLHKQIVQGQPYRHLLLSNSAASSANRRLHVYIEGDGLPWLNSRTVSTDPTPRNPLALRLMLQDPAPAIYLGRPCYFELQNDAACSPLLWTHQRYSAAVVYSLVAVLRGYLVSNPDLELSLIGYSGGGVLAMLMAPHLPEIDQVVTVAANLAVREWSDLHAFSPLDGSLDLAHQPPLMASIRQLHFAGENDTVVPTRIVRRVAQRQAPQTTRVIVIPGFDHQCCWQTAWSEILAKYL